MALIVAIISLILSQASSKEPTKVEINNVINNIYHQESNLNLQVVPERLMPQRRSKKIGRNEPCSCGSGKKHKKCCLKKI